MKQFVTWPQNEKENAGQEGILLEFPYNTGCNYQWFTNPAKILSCALRADLCTCFLTCRQKQLQKRNIGLWERRSHLQKRLEGFGVWRPWAARDGSDDERRELFSPQNTCRAVKYQRAELLLLMETSAETRQKKHPSIQPGNDKVVK